MATLTDQDKLNILLSVKAEIAAAEVAQAADKYRTAVFNKMVGMNDAQRAAALDAAIADLQLKVQP